MGLYINDKNLRNMYKNRDEPKENNQKIYINTHVSEMVKEQERVNNSLKNTLFEIRTLYEQQQYKNEGKWTQIEDQLLELQQFNAHYEVIESQVTGHLKQLEKDNQKIKELIETDRLLDIDVQEQLSQVNSSYQGIAVQLEDAAKANEQLALKIDNQTQLQEQMSEQLSVQAESQEKIEERLDNQEALTEKVIRQVDHFRSLLFERTNYLSDKIEEASSYILGLLTDKQVQGNFLLYENTKRKEKSK